MSNLHFVNKYIISGEIKTISGLHIGGTNDGFSIGSIDAAVIKHPLTGAPYIPGSSLKGKMRSLTELRLGTLGTKSYSKQIQNGPTINPEHLAARLFGNISEENSRDRRNDATPKKKSQIPSRIIVRDAHLIQEKEENAEVTVDYSIPEVKTEVLIDRITSKAMPRSMERVPAGATFGLEMVLNVFKGEEHYAGNYLEDVLKSLLLVQDDYLGGKGSRGSGQISFILKKIVKKDMSYYEDPSEEPENVASDYKVKYSLLFSEQWK